MHASAPRPRLARRVLHRGLVAAGAAGILVAAFAPVSDAATVADSGWWDRNNGVPLNGAPPPAEGALRVANDPTGPSAVAAVRIQLDAGERQPTLVLRVIGDPAPATAGFLACTPEAPWTGDSGGPWGERPVADCEAGRAGGRVSADGTTVSFDLTILAESGVVDAVIGPVAAAGNPVGDTFVVDFAAPAETDVVTVQSSSSTTTPTTSPSASPTPTFDSGSSGSGSGSSGFTPAPSPGVPATIPAGTPTPDVATPDTAPTGDAAAPPLAGPGEEIAADAPLESDTSGRRLAGAGIAVVIAGVGAYLWNAERSKVAMSGPVVGGLGAFRRERDESAPAVS